MVDEKGDVSAFKDYKYVKSAVADTPKAPVASGAKPVAQKVETLEKISVPSSRVRTSGDRIFISPFAKRTAEQKGIDYTQIEGTGPSNRITYDDVINYIGGASISGSVQPSTRKSIAFRHAAVKSGVPTSTPTSPAKSTTPQTKQSEVKVQTIVTSPSAKYEDIVY